jgi:hypothetical protein
VSSARTHCRVPALAAALGSIIALAGCGTQKSTLPPPPSGASGFVPLTRLARYPEVYAGAAVTTLGTITKSAAGIWTITDAGVRTRIEVYPIALAAHWAGRLVYASGQLHVTFQTGYEFQLADIARADR